MHSRQLQIKTQAETILGPQNSLAIKSLQQVIRNPGKLYNPLIIHGDIATGKTYLLNQFKRWYLDSYSQDIVLCEEANAFKDSFIQSIRVNHFTEFHKKYRTCKILILDNIQELTGKSTLEQFRFLFDILYHSQVQMVFTTTVAPKDLAAFPEALRNRLISGLVVPLTEPDPQNRLQFVLRQCQILSIPYKFEALRWFTEQVHGSFQSIQNQLEQLCRRNPAALLSLEECQANFYQGVPLSLEKIQNMVAKEFGILPEELTKKSNKQVILYPRVVAIFLARECLGVSFKKLQDHYHLSPSTIRRAIKRAESLREDAFVGPVLDRLTKQFRQMKKSHFVTFLK